MIAKALSDALFKEPSYTITIQIYEHTYQTGLVGDLACSDPVDTVIETGRSRRFGSELGHQIDEQDENGVVQLFTRLDGLPSYFTIGEVHYDHLNHQIVLIAGEVVSIG